MNDDSVPKSVDDVFAKASRMSRAPVGSGSAQQPDQTSLHASLAAVANHARMEGATSGEKPAWRAPYAAQPTAVSPGEALPDTSLLETRAPDIPLPDTDVPDTATVAPLVEEAPAFAAAFTPRSEEIAALHDESTGSVDHEAESVLVEPSQPISVSESTVVRNVVPPEPDAPQQAPMTAAVPDPEPAPVAVPLQAPAHVHMSVQQPLAQPSADVDMAAAVDTELPLQPHPVEAVPAVDAVDATASPQLPVPVSVPVQMGPSNVERAKAKFAQAQGATRRATARARGAASAAATRGIARTRVETAAKLAMLRRLPRPALAATAGAAALAVIVGVAVQRWSDPPHTAVRVAQNAAPRVTQTTAPVLQTAQPAAPSVAPTPAPAPAAIASAEIVDTAIAPPAAAATAMTVVGPEAVAAAAEERPALRAVTEPADAGNTALANQLIGSMRSPGKAAADDVAASGWLASLAALDKQSRITVVRYDALQAARRAAAAQRIPALEVVAPLTLEPVYLVVRADSPLQFVHEIRGKAINAGAAASSRALTVDTLYRGLFDGPLPAHPLRALAEGAALDSLQEGKLDVVVIVGAAARAGLAGASAANGNAFRLLAFDPKQPVAQKALNSFLPVQVAAGSLGAIPTARTASLGMMSFVVTARQNGKPADDEHDRAIGRLADELCSTRSGVQRGTLAAQQRVDPAMQLDVGWPYSAAAQAVLSRCGAATGTAARTSGTPPGSS